MKHNTGLYLFGSYLKSVDPHDIDLLWLYNKMEMSPESIMVLVNERESFMEARLPLPIHHTILSIAEEMETGFLESVDGVFIGGLSEDVEALVDKLIQTKG